MANLLTDTVPVVGNPDASDHRGAHARKPYVPAERRRADVLRLLSDAACAVHRRGLAGALGNTRQALTDLVASGEVRYLGAGYYESASLPPVDAARVAVRALEEAGRQMGAGEFAALRLSPAHLVELEQSGIVERWSVGFALPRRPSGRQAALDAVASGPRPIAEIVALGVPRATVHTLVYMGRLRKVGPRLYAAPPGPPAAPSFRGRPRGGVPVCRSGSA